MPQGLKILIPFTCHQANNPFGDCKDEPLKNRNEYIALASATHRDYTPFIQNTWKSTSEANKLIQATAISGRHSTNMDNMSMSLLAAQVAKGQEVSYMHSCTRWITRIVERGMKPTHWTKFVLFFDFDLYSVHESALFLSF